MNKIVIGSMVITEWTSPGSNLDMEDSILSQADLLIERCLHKMLYDKEKDTLLKKSRAVPDRGWFLEKVLER